VGRRRVDGLLGPIRPRICALVSIRNCFRAHLFDSARTAASSSTNPGRLTRNFLKITVFSGPPGCRIEESPEYPFYAHLFVVSVITVETDRCHKRLIAFLRDEKQGDNNGNRPTVKGPRRRTRPDLEKQFGQGSIMRMGRTESDMNIRVDCDPGALALDMAPRIVGCPAVASSSSTPEILGKSTLAMHVVARSQRSTVASVPHRRRARDLYARAIGVNVSDLLHLPADTPAGPRRSRHAESARGT